MRCSALKIGHVVFVPISLLVRLNTSIMWPLGVGEDISATQDAIEPSNRFFEEKLLLLFSAFLHVYQFKLNYAVYVILLNLLIDITAASICMIAKEAHMTSSPPLVHLSGLTQAQYKTRLSHDDR